MPGRKTFLVGLNTGFAVDGEPDERACRFFKERSGSGLHCAIVGNAVLAGGHASNNVAAVISDSGSWRRLAESIAEAGALPGIQLATAWQGYEGNRKFLAPNQTAAIAEYRRIASEFPLPQVPSLIDALRRSTDIATRSGFKHIQLHAAHGYLFSLLVDARLYPGSDILLRAVGDWSRELMLSGFETSIRFSLKSGETEFDAQGDDFYGRIASLPASYIDASSGYYNVNKQLIYPALSQILKARRRDTIELAQRFPSVQFIFSGRSLALDAESLPDNVHIGLCRDLIANPNFLVDRSRGCKNSGKCHYFSRGAPHITCSQWGEKEER